MLYTSYFGFARDLSPKYLVSVAGKAPAGFAGTSFRALAPKYDWWKKWHDEKLSEEWYEKMYHETVLDKLNPSEVARELGDNKVLLCWESVGSFCHRHIVAKWLSAAGIPIREMTVFDRRILSDGSR